MLLSRGEGLLNDDDDDDDDDDNNNNNNNNNMLQELGKCLKYSRFLYAVQILVLVFLVFLFSISLSGLNRDVNVPQ